MKLLLDTNCVIAAEAPKVQHPDSVRILSLLALANDLGHDLFVHPGTLRDLSHDKNLPRRAASEAQLGKYRLLDSIPFPPDIAKRAGYPEPLSPNDYVDLSMLVALERKAVDVFVTQDARLRRAAATLGLTNQVFSIAEAIQHLEALRPREVRHPSVEATKAYTLDPADPFFDSLRADYSTFDDWLAKVSAEHRDCLVIYDLSGGLIGAAILKKETHDEYSLGTNIVKICLLKAASEGRRYGELLLKAIFDSATWRQASAMYVEVFPAHDATIALLENFGFGEIGQSTKGEVVLAKRREITTDVIGMDALSYHKAFGPPAIRVEQAFVIPIQPRWHNVLFPELCNTPDLFGTGPSGNALTKAYLCKSQTTLLHPGDTVLFYRSEHHQGVTVAGVVEETLRSRNSDELLRFVGNRTVYTEQEVKEKCATGPVLAILFRRDRVLDPCWNLQDLQESRAVVGVPQSVTQIKEGAIEWLQNRLDASL